MTLMQERAQLLMECLPYIKQYRGQTVVIKYGGHAMKDEALQKSFAMNVVLLKYVGIHPVIVHGGGPQIGQMLQQLGIESSFCEGMRITDAATMNVVEMVLGGRVNKDIVTLLNVAGVPAVGLSGKDGALIEARKMQLLRVSPTTNTPEYVDLGLVGEVVNVNVSLLEVLNGNGFIPVIAPLGVGAQGQTYNINADLVAGAVASALKARRFILLTDVAGILSKEQTLLSSLTMAQAKALFEDGTLTGGMIPKVRCCLNALENGVEKAMIIDGRLENSLLLELFTDEGTGTEIVGV